MELPVVVIEEFDSAIAEVALPKHVTSTLRPTKVWRANTLVASAIVYANSFSIRSTFLTRFIDPEAASRHSYPT